MPLFKCDQCGCVENTAASGYNWKSEDSPSLCSLCDPEIGKWHGIFERKSASGYLLGNDGFLYHKKSLESGQLDWRIANQGFKIIEELP